MVVLRRAALNSNGVAERVKREQKRYGEKYADCVCVYVCVNT